MNAKDCMWARFRAICETPRTCVDLDMPVACIFCQWDAKVAWEECQEEQKSEIVKAVEEALAEDEAKEKDEPPENPFW